jgi:hypothetical protein
MIDRLVSLKVELLSPSVKVPVYEVSDALAQSFAITNGGLQLVTDEPLLTWRATYLICWVGDRSNSPETFRTFIVPSVGDGPVRFLFCGTIIEPSTRTVTRALTEQMLKKIEEIFTILRRNAILEETLDITDRGPVLHYVESKRYPVLPFDSSPSVAELISGCLTDLECEGKGFAWLNAARLRNVIAVPAGIETLGSDDIIIGQYHTPADRGREQISYELQLPDKVEDVLLLKGIINCWKRRIDNIVRGFEIDPAHVSPIEINSLSKTVFAYETHMEGRAKWVNVYYDILQQLRIIRQMSAVRWYMGRLVATEPLPRYGVSFTKRFFFDDISGVLRFLFEEVQEALSFRERLNRAEGDHIQQVFDFGVAQENMKLQKAVTRLTRALVFLTVFLFLLTGVLVFDSPTVKGWLERKSPINDPPSNTAQLERTTGQASCLPRGVVPHCR